MKETKINVIKQFKVKRNYIVYLIEEDDSYEFYIQHKDYTIIVLMFGLPKEQQTLKDAIKICEANLGEQIRYYKAEYED